MHANDDTAGEPVVTHAAPSDRERVLGHFERCRATPGAPFPEANFLDHLVATPSGERAAYNSFAGLRRLNRFIDAVQLDFGICLSLKDRDANYSLQAFVDRVDALRKSRRSSLASLRNRQQHRFGWPPVIFGNLLAFPLGMLAWRVTPALGAIVAVACLVATGLAVRLYVLDRRYLQRLAARIDSAVRDPEPGAEDASGSTSSVTP